MILPDDYPPDLPPPTPPKSAHNPFPRRSASQSSSDPQDSSMAASSSNSIDRSAEPGSSRNNDSTSTPPTDNSGPDPLNEELPPAYTPAADSSQGETTIEYGPRRPFQPVHQPPVIPQQTGWPMGPHPPGRPWNQYPRFPPRMGMIPPVPPVPQIPQPPFLQPPPQHPLTIARTNTMHHQGPMSAPPLPSRPVSDFARDFYAAGADADMSLLGGSVRQYAPTPGPSRDAAPANQSTPLPGGPPARSEGPVSPQIPDDGSPTKTPVPGHPLLRDGKILVFPPEFECKKCMVIYLHW